jgi:hypothetical protein
VFTCQHDKISTYFWWLCLPKCSFHPSEPSLGWVLWMWSELSCCQEVVGVDVQGGGANSVKTATLQLWLWYSSGWWNLAPYLYPCDSWPENHGFTCTHVEPYIQVLETTKGISDEQRFWSLSKKRLPGHTGRAVETSYTRTIISIAPCLYSRLRTIMDEPHQDKCPWIISMDASGCHPQISMDYGSSMGIQIF